MGLAMCAEQRFANLRATYLQLPAFRLLTYRCNLADNPLNSGGGRSTAAPVKNTESANDGNHGTVLSRAVRQPSTKARMDQHVHVCGEYSDDRSMCAMSRYENSCDS